METAVFDGSGKLVNVLKFGANYGFEALPPRFKSENPRFLRLSGFYNQKKKEAPRFRLDFYEYRDGQMVNLSSGNDIPVGK